MKIREPVLILFKKSRLIGAQQRKMSINIGGMRKPYHNQENTFDKSDLVSKDPIEQFRAWFDEATKHDKIEEANAMHIATATPDGIPSGRFVLLKGYAKVSNGSVCTIVRYVDGQSTEAMGPCKK